MKKYIKIIFVSTLLAGMVSCNKDMNGLLNNPNLPSPTTADVDLYLNQVQLSFNGFYSTASDYGAQLSRQQIWYGPIYQNAYQPASFDGEWEGAYTGVLNNATSLIPLAESQKKYIQAGIARVLMAYTYGTLVDDFGDIPFTESELGAANTNPSADHGAAVYAGVQTMLDSAIADFNKTGPAPVPSDLFYGGNAVKWITLANTLKLKFYMQTRLVDNTAAANIQALVTTNNLINSPSQDFQFQYGTSLSNPDSRHPHYGADYVSGGGGEYLSNYFMWKVVTQKYNGAVTILNSSASAAGDPRARYYFYRETSSSGSFSPTSVPCAFVPSPPSWYVNFVPARGSWYSTVGVPANTPFCYCGKGYFGRDYGDNSGTSPDQTFRTQWGIYPAGGQFDANQYVPTSLGLGAGGSGISPIWLSSYTQFLVAEAVLTLGIVSPNGTAATLMQNGMDASINKVLGFPAAIGQSSLVPAALVPTAAQITAYETLVLNNFNSAGPAQQLDILESEYMIAAWGNGVEPYNNLRRTGSPVDVQPALTSPTPGIYIYSFFYPSVYVNRNTNAPAQKNPGMAGNHVFWDNNPDNFIQ